MRVSLPGSARPSLCPIILAVSALGGAPSALAAETPTLTNLVEKLLDADGSRERRKVSERIAVNPQWGFDAVYRELREGRRFRADLKVGFRDESRRNSDGQLHRYLLAVPKSYTPDRRYPVRVYLHGGVTRPAWEGEATWWRDRERLLQEDHISIVPASWNESKWWQDSQVENVAAILRDVRRAYNVDENRVSLIGRSDGGTGAWYFAFHCPTPWASYLSFVGSPTVLTNPAVGADGPLFFFNVTGRSILAINGSADPLYPAESQRPLMSAFKEVGADITFEVEEGGHNTNWWPRRAQQIDAFIESHPRDPLPEHVFWATERTDRGNRSSWVVIDALAPRDDCGSSEISVLGKAPRRCGGVDVVRKGNVVEVLTRGVDRYRLLLSPEEFDLDAEVVVRTNGRESFRGRVARSTETLLRWAAEDVDRTMLFAAELEIAVLDPPPKK